VSLNFKKNTGFSIDEMQTTVRTLGNTLMGCAPAAEFIEPLNKLAVYYAHQKDQLRGFEKNSQKLEENLRIIDGWIKDTKALVQALTS